MLVNNRILEPASAMRTVESETVAGVSRTTVVTETVYAIINTVKAHIQDVHPERYVTIPKDEFMRLSKWSSEEDVVRDDTDSYTITYDIFKRAVIYQLTALGYDASFTQNHLSNDPEELYITWVLPEDIVE